MEHAKGVVRVLVAVVTVIALIVLFVDATGFLSDNSWRDPSAIQIMQVYIEKFIAPALLTIGIAIAVYIGTRAWDGQRGQNGQLGQSGSSAVGSGVGDARHEGDPSEQSREVPVGPGFCEHRKWRAECPVCNPPAQGTA